MDPNLREWFEQEGMMRYAIQGDEHGEITELACAPVVALGPSDADFVWAPNPDAQGYPGPPLREMTIEDYNAFLFRWFEQAVTAGAVRCANCGKQILAGGDLPDADTWDAIMIEKEIVAWMLVHFDCKKWLAKKIKGLHPFELTPGEPARYDRWDPAAWTEEERRDATKRS